MTTLKFHNPTSETQRFELEGKVYEVPAGGDVDVPSRLAYCLQHLHGCGHKTGACATTGRCHDLANAPPKAVIVGGLAPGLVHEHQKYPAWRPSLPRVVRD